MVNKINLPTASKQNEIHEDVKQLKESSGAGKKYETRIHNPIIRKGEVGEISFKGQLVSLVFSSTYASEHVEVKEIRIDGKNIIDDDEFLYVRGGSYLNIDLDLPVKNNLSIEAMKYSSQATLRVTIVAKHEVSE